MFDYAVHELGYSEDQAHRRIQAMRLIKSVPEVKEKLNSGSLSLTNAAKAQSLFRRTSQSESTKKLNKQCKLSVLKTIERKSTREAEKELLKLQPNDFVARDRRRDVSPTQTEIKVVLEQGTLIKLEEVKALLGSKASEMSHDQLLQIMAELTIEKLNEKKFGKRRVGNDQVERKEQRKTKEAPLGSTKAVKSRNQRYISQAVKHLVWRRDGGQCTKCRSRRHLQFDHVRPVAFGGKSEEENLRLLCFNCNQREAVKALGLERSLSRYSTG